MSNDTHDTTETTTDRTLTPAEQRDARHLFDDLRAWGQVLRDTTPPGFGLFYVPTPAERIATHAWQQYQAVVGQLERLFSDNAQPPTHDEGGAK